MKLLMYVAAFICLNVSQKPLIFPLQNGIVTKEAIDSNNLAHPYGIAIKATNSVSVKSCSQGIVSQVKTVNNRIFVIISASNRTSYCYDNLSMALVKRGMEIKVGQMIGKLSSEPGESFLNFSVWKKDISLDARKFLIYRQK